MKSTAFTSRFLPVAFPVAILVGAGCDSTSDLSNDSGLPDVTQEDGAISDVFIEFGNIGDDGVKHDGNIGDSGNDLFVDTGVDALVDVFQDAVDPADVDSPADVSTDVPPDPIIPGVEIEFEVSDQYLARKGEYLQQCLDNCGTDNCGLTAAVCHVSAGENEINQVKLDEELAKMNEKRDTADFQLAKMVRLLYLDKTTQALSTENRTAIEEAVVGFKYWLDEPGQDKMCYWSENHQILFHSGELLAGQLYRDKVFVNDGKTGTDHVAHATPLVIRWLDFRGRIGFSEWHSNVYFNEDLPAVMNLVDYAEDPDIRTKAAMVMDVMLLDMSLNYFKGRWATVHGRTYDSKLLNGLSDSIEEAVWLSTGLGGHPSSDNFGAVFMATSPEYAPPEVIEDVANASAERFENRQRDSIDVADGPAWGLGYESDDDVVFWAGMAAIAAPDVIVGLSEMLERNDLWDGFLFGDLPSDYKSILVDNVGMSTLYDLAKGLEPLGLGMALESMSTYTYRTPFYQLSGAQNYKPTGWGTQTHMWQATLDRDCYVFTTYPATIKGVDVGGLDFAGDWIGGWLPRVTMHRNVGVIQYRPPQNASATAIISGDYTHAFFPKERFDEVYQDGPWTMGRKGDAFVALASREATRWNEEDARELIADGLENTFVVEVASIDEYTDFADFKTKISGAELTFGDTVVYQSPTVGMVEVGFEGPMTIDDSVVPLGGHERFDNIYVAQTWGSPQMVVTFENRALVLDFHRTTRLLYEKN